MLNDKVWTYDELSAPHLKLMRLIAMIPFEGKTINYISTKILSIYWHIILLLYNFMFVGYGIQMAKRKDFEIDYVSEQTIALNITLSYLLLFYNRAQLIKVVAKCKELWSYVKADETVFVRLYERKAYYFLSITMVNLFAIVTSFIVTAVFKKVPSQNANGTEVKKVLPFRYFKDVQEEPMFTILSLIQGIVTYGITIIDVGTTAVMFYLILLACGYLKSIKTRLTRLAKRQDEIDMNSKECENKVEIIYNEIITCIKFHQNIMIYCEEIERFMRSIYFIGVFTTTYNMSMLGLTILKTRSEISKYLSLFSLNFIKFVTCQWSPEKLLLESGLIAHAAYLASLKLIGDQSKTNKALYFLILRSQKPIQLTAGGYLKLSLETLSNMMKSAFAFLTLLRKFNI